MATIRINITKQQLQSLFQNGEMVITIEEKDLCANQVEQPNCQISLFELFRQWIEGMKQTGNLRTSETYKTVLNRFCQFRHGEDLPIAGITASLLEQYQGYLRSQNLTMNTISFHMRILRSVYHKGVKQGLAIDSKPFKSVYTGKPVTQKRAISADMLQRISRLQLDKPYLHFARDMFLLSFYLRGMSFVDMAYLKTSDLHDGRLDYKRRKTGQMMTIRWERQMQDIIDRYPNPGEKYLLPIIRKQNGKERNQYRHCQTIINKNLKEVARLAGIDMNLTMYCARHTWATLAHDMQVPISIISRAMGHSDERTTEIYIRSIDVSYIDKANLQLMNALL